MKPASIKPTSADSAVCQPIVLRQSDTVRLVFKPLLVATSKDSLLKSCYELATHSAFGFEAFDPPALAVAGSSMQLTDETRTKSFELFRNGLKDVSILTYDEMFAKIASLVRLLEGDPF
jgi:hypothetical protein